MELNELRRRSRRASSTTHLVELRREQFNLRMQKGAGQLPQTHQLGRVRREIAQVKTLLGAKK